MRMLKMRIFLFFVSAYTNKLRRRDEGTDDKSFQKLYFKIHFKKLQAEIKILVIIHLNKN